MKQKQYNRIMRKHQTYDRPRIKVLRIEDLMQLPTSIPDPGFGAKETDFEENADPEITRTNVWEE